MDLFNLVLEILVKTWKFDFSFVRPLIENPLGLAAALIIFALVGISFLLKDFSILILNKTSLNQILRLILVNAFMYIISFLLWIIISWAIAALLFGAQISDLRIYAILIGVASAPGVLMFFSIIPYFGILIEWLIFIWMYILMFIAARGLFALNIWQTLLITVLGFLILNALLAWTRKSTFRQNLIFTSDKGVKNDIEEASMKVKQMLASQK